MKVKMQSNRESTKPSKEREPIAVNKAESNSISPKDTHVNIQVEDKIKVLCHRKIHIKRLFLTGNHPKSITWQ